MSDAPQAGEADSEVVTVDVTADESATADAHPAANDPLYGYADATEALTDTVSNLERVTAERDSYLELAQRVQADFENYKRRVEGQRVEERQRAAESLVIEILPVLDACEAAVSHGSEDGAAIHAALFTTLERRGLARLDVVGAPFDPEVHEAVMTEAAAEGDAGPTVTEVMRTGYTWNGRVVRPAMVKVRG